MTGGGYQRFPNIRKIVYPNTVEKIVYSGKPLTVNNSGNEYINKLLEIVLSNNTNAINSYEFANLDFFRIDIPNNITIIGEGAFESCLNLHEVKMSDNLEKIGAEAFQECYELTEITIPKNVTDISKGTFRYSGLTKVNIEGKLNTIGEYAFDGCDGIKEIVIPGNIEYIGQRAFQNWGEDQTIYFECPETVERNWNYNWDYNCKAKIVWDYNPDGATE